MQLWEMPNISSEFDKNAGDIKNGGDIGWNCSSFPGNERKWEDLNSLRHYWHPIHLQSNSSPPTYTFLDPTSMKLIRGGCQICLTGVCGLWEAAWMCDTAHTLTQSFKNIAAFAIVFFTLLNISEYRIHYCRFRKQNIFLILQPIKRWTDPRFFVFCASVWACVSNLKTSEINTEVDGINIKCSLLAVFFSAKMYTHDLDQPFSYSMQVSVDKEGPMRRNPEDTHQSQLC